MNLLFKLLKAILLTGVVAIIITPLIYCHELAFGINSAKFFWCLFTTIVLIPFILSLAVKYKPTVADLLVSIFIAFLIIHTLYCDNHPFENKKTINFLCSFWVYTGIKLTQNFRLFKAPDYILQMLYFIALLFCTLSICIYALGQKFGYLQSFNPAFPVTGTFFHPAPLACYVSTIFPIGVYLSWTLLEIKGKGVKVFKALSVVTVCLMVIIVPITFSRSALIGITGGLCYLFIHNKLSDLNLLAKKHFKGIAISVLALVSISALFYNARPESAQGRIVVWKITRSIIEQNPLLGSGMDSFKSIYPRYQIDYFKDSKRSQTEINRSYEVNNCFSEPIQITCELGIVGFLLFTITVYVVLASNMRPPDKHIASGNINRAIKAGASASLISFLLFSFFSYPFALTELTLTFFILLALADNTSLMNHRIYYFFQLALAFVAVFLVSGLKTNLELVKSYRKWEIANAAKSSNHLSEASFTYKSIYDVLQNNDFFLSDYARTLFAEQQFDLCAKILNKRKGPAFDDLLLLGNCYMKTGDYKHAQSAFQTAYYLLPQKFISLYLLMNAYLSDNNVEGAKSIASQIVKKKIIVNSYQIDAFVLKAQEVLKMHTGLSK